MMSDFPTYPPQDETPSGDENDGLHELSVRQQQILALLRAGKVNKEIASELGIGLGTVKQHVVALFKKLKVSNRTMAVSRLLPPTELASIQLGDAGLIERRPCVVASFSLTAEASDDTHRALHHILAAHAYDQNAIYLARRGSGGDLIFGIHQSGEDLPYQTLQSVRSLLDALEAMHVDTRSIVGCGITAGIALASMCRTGGWSGEAIASMALAQSRQLAMTSSHGLLSMGKPFRDLLAYRSPNLRLSPALGFAAIGNFLQPSPATKAEVVFGREKELERIGDWLAQAESGNEWLLIEGELGMGKTSLCRHAIQQAHASGLAIRDLRCRLHGGEVWIDDLKDGVTMPAEKMLATLRSKRNTRRTPCILDDVHILSGNLLQNLVSLEAAGNRAMLLAARPTGVLANFVTSPMRLGRLSPDATLSIVSQFMTKGDVAHTDMIAHQAAGVPLFAMELAHAQGVLPLSLQFLIAGRIDRLKPDRLLLRHVARPPGEWSEARLARAMNETPSALAPAIEQAIRAGVLQRSPQRILSFTHPLLRQAILHAEVVST